LPELSGIEVLVLVKEMDCKLRGAYVNNVYSIGEAQVIRFRQPGGEDSWVVVSPEFGAWVSASVSERAETTPFTSLLRGAVERGSVEGVSQTGLDRIFDFRFRVADDERHLIVELMPPGNIVVVGRDGAVLLAQREVRTPARRIARGAPYSPPAQRRASPEGTTGRDVARMLRAERTLGQALGRNLALPRKYIREVLARSSLSESASAGEHLEKADEIASAISGLVAEARNDPHPCLARTPEGVEIFAVHPRSVEVQSQSETLGAICDEVLLPRVLERLEPPLPKESNRKGELESTLNRLRLQEAGLLEEASRLRELARQVARTTSVEGAGNLLREAGVTSQDRGESSPAALSSAVYDRAKELERKSSEAHEAAKKIGRRLAKEKSPAPSVPKELRRETREWYERFRWFYTTGGKLAIGGRDAQSNSLLVRRHLEKNDVAYHADLFGSPFFVLKGGSNQTSEETLELAQATVSFSSAWKTGLSAGDAFWVGPDQVGTSAPSGEYLARGSFMIRGRKNFVRRMLVEVAVGIDESGRVVAGPESAVAAHAKGYLVLAPHREKPSETAKKVVKELEPLGLKRTTAVDEVLRVLPAGGGKIVRRKLAKTQPADNV